MIKSGFIGSNSNSSKKKCQYQIVTRQSVKYSDQNTIMNELKYILIDFNNNLITFKDLVDQIHQLISQYDFGLISEVLQKQYPDSSFTYLDKIVSLLWSSDTIARSYNSLVNLVSYIYPTVANKTQVIKRISQLTFESYNNISDPNKNIQFDEIYSNQKLSIVCAYSWIFAEYLSDIPELWNLLDNSIVYSYKLYNHITTQIEYFNIIVNENPLCEFLLEELYGFQKKIKNIIQKFPNWVLALNMNPQDSNQYRIYYYIYVIVRQFKLGTIMTPKIPSLEKNTAVVVTDESVMQILPYITHTDINVDILDIFLNISSKIQSHSENLIHENVVIMQNINDCLINFKDHFKNLFENNSKHSLLNEWIHIYLNSIFHTLDLLSNSISQILTIDLDNNDNLSVYSYNIVNIKKCYSLILSSLRILKDFNTFMNILNIDIKYQYRNLLNATIKHLNIERYNEIISNNELVALTIILFDLIELLPDDDFIEFKNEHDLEILSDMIIPIPDTLHNKLYNLIDIDYPDEFLDPITNQIIINPIRLPDTLQIMDQKVIYHILRNNPVNPFNMKPLTVAELDQYNQQPEIQNILSDFNHKKLKFIMSTNKNKNENTNDHI